MEKVYATGFHNPFLPLDVYIPDGEPKVFDGRVYLYGSKDVFGGEYCCHKYHVYSADIDDLQHWTDHGPALASTDEYAEEGIWDGVPWSDGLLWAPDVAWRDGWYYLFFCLSDGSEGVARSRNPYGPFVDAKQIMMGGKPIFGIDPSVLQDGDNYYYTWGQGNCHMAKLNEDMCTLDPETYVDALISHEDGMQGFHEGSSLRKIGEYYCLVYASEYSEEYPHRGAAPTKLGYAVSKNIYGPYEYRGTIIDNVGIDPSTWNNHGSIIKIKDQWYVFYHGSSDNRKYNRRARVERITVDEERAVIRQAQMTSLGFSEALDPRECIEAACGCQVSGGAYFTERGSEHPLVHISSGSSVVFRYFDYGKGKKDWKVRLGVRPLACGSIALLVNGECRGEIEFTPQQEETDELVELERVLFGVSGKAELCLQFRSQDSGFLAELYWLEQECLQRKCLDEKHMERDCSKLECTEQECLRQKGMEIRYVREEDKEFWYRLDKHLPEPEFAGKVRDKRGYVLLENGVLIGVLRYNLFWDNTPFCTLLFIDERYQGCGYGRMLMEHWEEEMKQQGYGMALVSTQVDENAQHFYRKLGYKDCGGLIIDIPEYAQPMELFLAKAL